MCEYHFIFSTVPVSSGYFIATVTRFISSLATVSLTKVWHIPLCLSPAFPPSPPWWFPSHLLTFAFRLSVFPFLFSSFFLSPVSLFHPLFLSCFSCFTFFSFLLLFLLLISSFFLPSVLSSYLSYCYGCFSPFLHSLSFPLFFKSMSSTP